MIADMFVDMWDWLVSWFSKKPIEQEPKRSEFWVGDWQKPSTLRPQLTSFVDTDGTIQTFDSTHMPNVDTKVFTGPLTITSKQIEIRSADGNSKGTKLFIDGVEQHNVRSIKVDICRERAMTVTAVYIIPSAMAVLNDHTELDEVASLKQQLAEKDEFIKNIEESHAVLSAAEIDRELRDDELKKMKFELQAAERNIERRAARIEPLEKLVAQYVEEHREDLDE